MGKILNRHVDQLMIWTQ